MFNGACDKITHFDLEFVTSQWEVVTVCPPFENYCSAGSFKVAMFGPWFGISDVKCN